MGTRADQEFSIAAQQVWKTLIGWCDIPKTSRIVLFFSAREHRFRNLGQVQQCVRNNSACGIDFSAQT